MSGGKTASKRIFLSVTHQSARVSPVREKIRNAHTCNEILSTLRSMQVTLLSKESVYIPSYRRTDLTDDLHKAFGFHTEHEFISRSAMRSIIESTKTEEVKNSTDRFQRKNGYSQHDYWVCCHFLLYRCQTREYTTFILSFIPFILFYGKLLRTRKLTHSLSIHRFTKKDCRQRTDQRRHDRRPDDPRRVHTAVLLPIRNHIDGYQLQ